MASFLLAPIRVELLHLPASTQVVQAAFDPTLLPRTVADRDLNSDIAFLGGEVTSPPFQNRNLPLPPGIHLHWQLPRELTRGQSDPSGRRKQGNHPRLPNRWFISRTLGPPLRWIVESDYIHPLGQSAFSNTTAYPTFGTGWRTQGEPGFRQLGRTLPLTDWLERGNRGEYLEGGLTVMGYGHPSFAAFAPNCRGVFTFHDPAGVGLETAQYLVIGFYSEAADEPSLPSIPSLAGRFHSPATAGDDASMKPRPRILCLGRTSQSRPASEESPSTSSFLDARGARAKRLTRRRGKTEAAGGGVRIAVGNSATEALSAFLGDCLGSGPTEKSLIEDHLEAILMAADIQARLQDQHAKFLERRHANGFSSFHGGIRWLIKPETSPAPAHAQQPAAEGPEGPAIPETCVGPLHELNGLQRRLERLQNSRRTVLDRLYADWHKYMLCAYPPAAARDVYPEADRVAYLIRATTFATISKLDSAIREVTQRRNGVAEQIERLLSPTGPAPSGAMLRLKAIPGPRYWAPRDPVVVLAAPAELARHLPRSTERLDDAAIWREIELPHNPGLSLWDILENVASEHAAASEWQDRSRQDDPARPIFVEWSARLVSPAPAFRDHEDRFDPDYIASRFTPAAGSPDLTFSPAEQAEKELDQSGEINQDSAYAGRSLISAHAAQILHDRIAAYLGQILGHDKLAQLETDAEALRQQLQSLGVLEQPVMQTAVRAWEYLNTHQILCLPLGGFNEALLMRRHAPQLPIAEPIGFPEYRKFSAEVKALLGELPTRGPVPLARFNPIRMGELELDRLRVIDSFGRAYDIDVARDGIIPAETLRGHPVAPPPRFVQPLRVDFRWLSGSAENLESHSHPKTTPICGWLLPNRLEQSIAVYSAAGKELGSIDADGLWRPAPGDDHPVVPRDIENPNLRRVVLHILTQPRERAYPKAFLQAINASLEAIDPDSFAAHPAISLLVGRPIAVVRASVQFELLGEPAEDHSWELLSAQVAGKEIRPSRRFEEVKIPFRIGEHQMLNDGVVGYWIESGTDGFADDAFHSPQLDSPSPNAPGPGRAETDLRLNGRDRREFAVKRAPSDPPLALTLLMDPRGSAHLTSGVLPVKEIRLAEQHFVDALKNISVSFLAAPLLMLENRTEIMLPGEPGYSWSFLDRTPQGWKATPSGEIRPPELDASFRGAARLREGWLRLEPSKDLPGDTPTPST